MPELSPSTPAPALPDPGVVLGERARCGRVCDSLDGFERLLVEEQSK